MKIVNHQKGKYTFDDTNNGSVMYGSIYMSEKEFDDVVKFLRRRYAIAKRYNQTYKRDSLSHALDWTLKQHGSDKRICLGVCATELIFERYNLPRYKRQNYVICRV